MAVQVERGQNTSAAVEEKSVFQQRFGTKTDTDMADTNIANVPKRQEIKTRQIASQAGGDHRITQDSTAAHLAPAPAVHFRDTINRLAQKAGVEDTEQDAVLFEADSRKRRLLQEDTEMAEVGGDEVGMENLISDDLLKELEAANN